MVDEINYLRNQVSDKQRIKAIKNTNEIFNIFNNKSWHLLFNFLKQLKLKLLIVTITSILIAFLEGTKAGFIILLITVALAKKNDLEKYKDFEYINWFFDFNYFFQLDFRIFLIFSIIITLVFLTFISASAKIFIAWLNEKLTSGLLRIVRKKVLSKLFSFNIRYFSQAKSGELLFLMTSETNRFSVLINLFVAILTLIIQFVIFYTMLIFMLWQFTLLMTLIGIIYFFIHLKIDSRLKILSWTMNLSMNNLSQFFHQVIYGIKIIKISGLENREMKQYLNQHKKYENFRIKTGLISGISRAFQEIILFLTLGIILFLIINIYGFDYIINNSQIYLAFLFLLIRTLPVILALQNARVNLINAYGPLARVMNFISDENLENRYTNYTKSNHIDISKYEINSVKIENIKFSYEDKKILDIENYTFSKNKLIAIVGQSGSGKSTLLDLISSLLLPNNGNIFINEHNLKDINLSSFQKVLGYMNQEPIVFHDTIKNNIDFLKQNSTDEELWNSLKLSESYEFVNELENKFDHGLGERGQTLSGGQKQRLGLSRIFLQNPKLILLDEATNALDFKTEKIIYDNFKKLSNGKIIIIIAHRLSALTNFDEIVVLNNGKIVEVGNHKNLIEKKGIYYDMFNAQIKMENFSNFSKQ